MAGRLERFAGAWHLSSPIVVGDDEMAVVPVYAGDSAAARTRVRGLLASHACEVAHDLLDRLAEIGDEPAIMRLVGAAQWTLDEAIRQAHEPFDTMTGSAAIRVLDRIGALLAIQKAREGIPRHPAAWRAPAPWEECAQALPFALTNHQVKAIAEIHARLSQPTAMRHLLVGETGTGKTAVYSTLTMASLIGGARVAILLPNDTLACQVRDHLLEVWPNVRPHLQLLAGESDSDSASRAPLVVGTTALLHRPIGTRQFVVVDEQHRFSRAQRERLTAGGAHVLEVSASSTSPSCVRDTRTRRSKPDCGAPQSAARFSVPCALR